jgi:hypothetical protein
VGLRSSLKILRIIDLQELLELFINTYHYSRKIILKKYIKKLYYSIKYNKLTIKLLYFINKTNIFSRGLEGEEQGPFLESLVFLNKCKVIVEIGVAEAKTTAYLCAGAKSVGGYVYGYDIWDTHGLMQQFDHWSSMEKCKANLVSRGFNNFELTKINSRSPEFHNLIKSKHPQIDLAFIDGCHSYDGIKNDFDAIYKQLSPAGIVVFHDTQSIDGCREFMIDLRTKFWDGTYDVIDFPFGTCGGRDRRTGISILVKRSFAILGIAMDEQCNLENRFEEIYKKEKDWYRDEISKASN